MCKNNIKGYICHGCRFRGGVPNMCITICNAPQSDSKHPDYDKFKDVLFTDECPLKELEEDNAFLFWQ